MIKILCVGKLKERYWKDALQEYQKRISKYTKVNIIEVADSGFENVEKCRKVESDVIKKHLTKKEFIIVLDIDGEMLSSVEFSHHLEKLEMQYTNLTFIIGGSYGLSNEIKSFANYYLSFSKLTFPHQLFRVMLLEQLYRAYKIRNHESYHK